MRLSIKKLVHKFATNDGITFLLSLLIFVMLITGANIASGDHASLFDLTIFFSFIAAMIVQALSGFIAKIVINWTEDDIKLTGNYDKLAADFPPTRNADGSFNEPLVVCSNEGASPRNLKRLEAREGKPCKTVRVPVVVDSLLSPSTHISILDSSARYELPSVAREHYAELLAAHATSSVYNQLNIRVTSWGLQEGSFAINTMRTTYFDSLVTNRAMDLTLGTGVSLRQLFQFGPFVPALKDSPLSNHLGANGFVITSDGKVPLVFRGRANSIGKGSVGTSIAASMKAKYALDSSGRFTTEGLHNALLREAMDELKLDYDQLVALPLSSMLIAAYRDLLEGGKPQLLFVMRTTLTGEVLRRQFASRLRANSKGIPPWDLQSALSVDGDKLLMVDVSDFSRMAISSDLAVHDGRVLHILPSTAASLHLFREWLERDGASS